ncbi:MAG: type III-B CRISPR module RAMP protein Cmr4 [Desulfobacterales bacterium]|nr:type III-B CRISPR module RAMP protein Cmr4 [Desulfobacterales bacterium]
MFNTSVMFIYRAITPLHCGASEGGGVDLPVARERFTQFPIIPSSSLKGVWRDLCRGHWGKKDVCIAFGPEPDSADADKETLEKETKDREKGHLSGKTEKTGETRYYAGCLGFTDAQILFLPVRSGKGVFMMLTCPFQLRRYLEAEYFTRSGSAPDRIPAEPGPYEMHGIFEDHVLGKTPQSIFLEDIELKFKPLSKPGAYEFLPKVKPFARERLCIISDEIFRWFAVNALEIRAHNILDPVKKTSENLWYEEAVPAEAVFFAPVLSGKPRLSGGSGQGKDYIDKLFYTYKEKALFQIGGNETTGRGMMEITLAPFKQEENKKKNRKKGQVK